MRRLSSEEVNRAGQVLLTRIGCSHVYIRCLAYDSIIPYNTIRSGRALLASAEAGQDFGGG